MNLNFLPAHHNLASAPPPPGAAARIHHRAYFYWGKESEFLFQGWPDNNSGMYALALVLVLALAILIEFLSNLNLVRPGSSRGTTVFFQSGIHAIRAGFGYLVILAAVSCNCGVFIATVLGHAAGYVVFGGRFTEKEMARPD